MNQFFMHNYAHHIFRAIYNGSFSISVEPLKTLELHYPMIQFLKIMIVEFLLQYPLSSVSVPNSQSEGKGC